MTQVVSVSFKHNDAAQIEVLQRGKTLFEHDGYMPYVGVFGGDYTELKIDNETGRILDWVPLKIEDLVAETE